MRHRDGNGAELGEDLFSMHRGLLAMEALTFAERLQQARDLDHILESFATSSEGSEGSDEEEHGAWQQALGGRAGGGTDVTRPVRSASMLTVRLCPELSAVDDAASAASTRLGTGSTLGTHDGSATPSDAPSSGAPSSGAPSDGVSSLSTSAPRQCGAGHSLITAMGPGPNPGGISPTSRPSGTDGTAVGVRMARGGSASRRGPRTDSRGAQVASYQY